MESPDSQEFVVIDDKDVDDYEEEGLLPQPPEVLEKILKWLKPTEYSSDSSEYQKHLNSHTPGTGLWEQDTPNFQKWHESSEFGSLWIKAIAGAGKSVFAAMIASKLAETENVPVLYFFFRQIIATNHDPHSLCRDWICMTLNHSFSLQARMKKYMDDRRELESVSVNEFWHDITNALVSLPKVYCIVDALDEMDIDQESFFKSLISLGKRRPSSIKVLLTSRPLPRIEAFLKDPSILQVRLEQTKVDKDIAIYLDARMKQHQDIDDDLRAAVTKNIGMKAQGSFLYARLMMDELLDHLKQMIPDIKFIERSLTWLPSTLEDMYNGMLLDHSLRSRVPQELQLTILTWVTHSSRPLRLLELADMLDSETGQSGKDTKAIVRAACGPLLEILEDETISVIHHSFTEFLLDTDRATRAATNEQQHQQFPVINPADANKRISLACLRYLTSGCLKEWKITEDDRGGSHLPSGLKTQPNVVMKHPFLSYAHSHWFNHINKLETIDQDVLKMLDGFMDIENTDFQAWVDMTWSVTTTLAEISPLHVAAWAGMAGYVRHLLQKGVESNTGDQQGRTPLSWAAARGHTEVVRLLLEHISDPDVDDENGLKPLHHATSANHYKIVRLLIDAGVSPLTGKTKDPGRMCGNARSSIGDSPLRYAALSGCTQSLAEMVPHLEAKDLNQALCWSSETGKTQCVKVLLTSKDTSVDSPDQPDTPLFLAAGGLNYEIMKALLERGADPNKTSKNRPRGMYSWSPYSNLEKHYPNSFHALAGAGKGGYSRQTDDETIRKCFQLLLDYGCELGTKDNDGKTPLHHSMGIKDNYSGTEESGLLSRLLLENGANPMAIDNAGNTPLHMLRFGKETAPLVALLIEKGADINAVRPKDGQTPLHAAVDSIHSVDIKSLLPYVSDWNVKDNNGDTPLHIALSKSYSPDGVFQDLVDAGADLNCKNRKGECPIHVIRDYSTKGFNSSKILSLILAAGASLESRDNNGRTVLLRAAYSNMSNTLQTLQLLLESGADILARDFQGNNILHTVCKTIRNSSLIDFLVQAGADPLAVNHAGNTILHTALAELHNMDGEKLKELLNKIIDLGVSPDSQNHLGQTPFYLACATRPSHELYQRGGMFDSIFTHKIVLGINTPDHNGIMPIHLAGTLSEPLVAKLIQHGADITAKTYEGRNVLHIAARARESNIIGLVLDQLRVIGKLDLVNSPDDAGRTPLHDACRSGRFESVELLIEAGADVMHKDKAHVPPLNACAEFEEEKALWQQSDLAWTAKSNNLGLVYARGILDKDLSRPVVVSNGYVPGYSWAQIANEKHSVSIRKIIRLLVAKGAYVVVPQGGFGTNSALDAAMAHGCGEMIDELLSLQEVKNDPRAGYFAKRFESRYLVERCEATLLPEDLQTTGQPLWICNELLALGKYKTLSKIPEMTVGLFTEGSDDATYVWEFLTKLASYGYTEMFETFGMAINEPGWTEQFKCSKHSLDTKETYLVTAAKQSLPNLDIIKLLVKKFSADVNFQPTTQTWTPSGQKNVLGNTVLHVLASGTHWWHTKAMIYLLDHGANPELKGITGQSVLHVAIQSSKSGGYRALETIKVLLQHGADPNSLDENGLTCLNAAMHDIEIVRLLLKHGADITAGKDPVLFSAIESQDITAIEALLDAGADCNAKKEKQEVEANNRHALFLQNNNESYPLHTAASSRFNTTKTRESALQIVIILLKHGADPFMAIGDTTIIHNAFQTGGILNPFLEIPGLDLERRDQKGRTLLLAAAQSYASTSYPSTVARTMFNSISHQERLDDLKKLSAGDPLPSHTLYDMGADLTAVDNEGNNVLHLLVQATPHDNAEFEKTFSLFIEKEPSLIHQKNTLGYTSFHIAISHRNLWIVRTLLAAGADPLDPDPNGNTPLHYLAPVIHGLDSQTKYLPMFQEFLSLGVPINQKNIFGQSCLFPYFESAFNTEGLKYFDDAGADLFTRNNKGETLLHLVAKKKGDYGWSFSRPGRGDQEYVVDLFRFLMGRGLDPMVEDGRQRTALDVAAAFENQVILDLFKRDTKGELAPITEVKAKVPTPGLFGTFGGN